MQGVMLRAGRWTATLVLGAAMAACGGGGGGGGDSTPAAATTPTPSTPPAPDARNGDYTVVAADGFDYTLALDFDAKTYHLTGNGVDQSGAISEQSGTFFFAPGNASGASGASTTRFQVATDAVTGEFALPAGTVPFIAARKFVNTVADAAGTYNFLGRVVDTAGGAPNTFIQQAQITSGGQLLTCDNSTIFDMPNCPVTTVTPGTITVSGDLFTAATAAGNIRFRVAQVGTDKMFLRASASGGTTRRFVVGTPASATFTGDAFAGGTTEPAWGTVTLTTTSFASTGTSPAGATSTMTGTAVSSGFVPGIRAIDAGASGFFFAMRSSEIGMVVAARGSTVAPGFVAIGHKQ